MDGCLSCFLCKNPMKGDKYFLEVHTWRNDMDYPDITQEVVCAKHTGAGKKTIDKRTKPVGQLSSGEHTTRSTTLPTHFS